MVFLIAQMPIYLYPFLATIEKGKPLENIRTTSLSVLGALVKVEKKNVTLIKEG